jgi:hypothetical protein
MYANVCERNHQTPSRIMTLDHIRATAKNDSKKNNLAQSSTELVMINRPVDILIGRLNGILTDRQHERQTA